MKKKKLKIIYILVCLFGLISCEYEAFEPMPVVIDTPDGGLSFTTHIVPIFNSDCNGSGCHDASSKAGGLDLSAGTAYANLFAENLIDTIVPANSKLYTKLNNPGTHDGRSTPTDRGYILTWITEGAKDN